MKLSALIVFILCLTFSLSAQQTNQTPIQRPPVYFGGPLGPGGTYPAFSSGVITLTADADYTMVYPDTSASVIRITTATGVSLSTTRNIIAPQATGQFFGFEFVVQNATAGGQALLLRGTTGNGVTIPNGQAVLVIFDGTDYILVGAAGTGPGTTGWGNVVPNPFASIQDAINAGGGPVVSLATSNDHSTFTNPTNMRVWNFRQNQFGADSLFFRDVSEWGVIDGAATRCATTANSNVVNCSATFVNAVAPAGDVNKLIIIQGAGAGTYGQVVGGNSVTPGPNDLRVANVTGLIGGTPNSYQPVTFTDSTDGCTSMAAMPYGHVWLDASGLPSGATIIVSPYSHTTGIVEFRNFTGKGCVHPPTTGTIATVTGNVTFTGGSMATGDLVSTIATVTGPNTITLADTAVYATPGQVGTYYGTDAYPAFQAACNSISTNSFLSNGTLTFSGMALLSHGVDCNGAGLHIMGRAPHGMASAMIYAGKTPNNMMAPGGLTRATGGPSASAPLIPNAYVLNLAQGGAAKVERVHILGNSQAMPYGIIASFGAACYTPPSAPTTDCFRAPGTGGFINQATVIDQVTLGSFWGDPIADLGTMRLQSCIFSAGFTGNDDFWRIDHINCYGADAGLDSVNDQATDFHINQWFSEFDNIGITLQATTVDDYYTEFNRADIMMGSPYWPGGYPEGVDIKQYGGESSAMDFAGSSPVAYNGYSITCESCGLGGDQSVFGRPDGISSDFSYGLNLGSGNLGSSAGYPGYISWNGGIRGNVLIPFWTEGGPPAAFLGNFSVEQFRWPAGSAAYGPTSGWGSSNYKLRIQGGNRDITLPSNSADWITNLSPANDGTGTLTATLPPLIDVETKSERRIGSLTLDTVNWGQAGAPYIGYGTFAEMVCNGIVVGQPGFVACGSTQYNYAVTCVDSLGNESLPTPNYSGRALSPLGPASLSANPTNYMLVGIWMRQGCVSFNIYGDNGVGGVVGFLTNFTPVAYDGGNPFVSLADHGQFTKVTTRVPPATNQMGSLSVAGHIQIKTLLNAPGLATDALGNVIAGTGGGPSGIVSPFVIPSQDTTQNLTITVPNTGGGNPVLSSSTGTINIANLFVTNLAGTGTSILQTDALGNVARLSTATLPWSSLTSPDPTVTAPTLIFMGKHPTGIAYDFSTLTAPPDIAIGLNIIEQSASSPSPANLIVLQTSNPTTDPLVINTGGGVNSWAFTGTGDLLAAGAAKVVAPVRLPNVLGATSLATNPTGDIIAGTGGPGGGGGTVTSVGLTDSTGEFNITGSPVTTSGNINLALLPQPSSSVLAGSPNVTTVVPTIVQANICGTATGATVTCGFATPTTAGSLVLILAPRNAVTPVTDNLGQTYTIVSLPATYVPAFYVENSAAGVTSTSFTMPAGGGVSVILEIAGIQKSLSFDSNSYNVGNITGSNTPITWAAITTTAPNDIVIGWWTCPTNSVALPTPVAPFTVGGGGSTGYFTLPSNGWSAGFVWNTPASPGMDTPLVGSVNCPNQQMSGAIAFRAALSPTSAPPSFRPLISTDIPAVHWSALSDPVPNALVQLNMGTGLTLWFTNVNATGTVADYGTAFGIIDNSSPPTPIIQPPNYRDVFSVSSNQYNVRPLDIISNSGNTGGGSLGGFYVDGPKGDIVMYGQSGIKIPSTASTATGIISAPPITSDTAIYSPAYFTCTAAAPCITPAIAPLSNNPSSRGMPTPTGQAGNAPTQRAKTGGEPLSSFHLGDFSTTKPTNGQVPIFDSASGKYVPGPMTGGPGGGPVSWTDVGAGTNTNLLQMGTNGQILPSSAGGTVIANYLVGAGTGGQGTSGATRAIPPLAPGYLHVNTSGQLAWDTPTSGTSPIGQVTRICEDQGTVQGQTVLVCTPPTSGSYYKGESYTFFPKFTTNVANQTIVVDNRTPSVTLSSTPTGVNVVSPNLSTNWPITVTFDGTRFWAGCSMNTNPPSVSAGNMLTGAGANGCTGPSYWGVGGAVTFGPTVGGNVIIGSGPVNNSTGPGGYSATFAPTNVATPYSNVAGGKAILRGSDANFTGASNVANMAAGGVEVRPGLATGNIDRVTTLNMPGLAIEVVGFTRRQSTKGFPACVYASAPTPGMSPTYDSCNAASILKWVGIWSGDTTGAAANTIQVEGDVPFASLNPEQWTAGDYICLDVTYGGGFIHSSSACAGGQQAGIATFSDTGTTTLHYGVIARR